tara:strand:+ start:35 stop:223 length:189 start_codon:yes stop_codon:yes gene_type:complete
MKKRIIAILFCIILLVPSCASSKTVIPKSEPIAAEKVVSKDPLMKLLASALIIYAIQILVTK